LTRRPGEDHRKQGGRRGSHERSQV
jgi:hypothetical protein